VEGGVGLTLTQCVSVYWHKDDTNRRLVVGYVGPHLRTVSR
jgi:hypothetical protein